MAYSFIVGTAKASTDGNNVTTDAIDTSGADVIYVEFSDYDPDPATLSDSKSNTWSQVTTAAAGGVPKSRLFRSQASPVVGSGHTFTATGGVTSFPSIAMAAFSGVKVSPADQNNVSSGSAITTLATGTVTPTEDNELIIAGAATQGVGIDPSSIDNGMTVAAHTAASAVAFGAGIAYKIQTTAAAINPTWTFSGSATNAAAGILTSKAAAVAGRTTKNTRTSPLGIEIGMGWRMDL